VRKLQFPVLLFLTVVDTSGVPAGKLGRRQAAAADVGEAFSLPTARSDRPPILLPAAREVTVVQRAEALSTTLVHAKNKTTVILAKKDSSRRGKASGTFNTSPARNRERPNRLGSRCSIAHRSRDRCRLKLDDPVRTVESLKDFKKLPNET